ARAPLLPGREVHSAGDDRARHRQPHRRQAVRALPAREAGTATGMTVARLRLALVGETVFPLRDPFFRSRLSPRAAAIAAPAEEKEGGNLTGSPFAPSL